MDRFNAGGVHRQDAGTPEATPWRPPPIVGWRPLASLAFDPPITAAPTPPAAAAIDAGRYEEAGREVAEVKAVWNGSVLAAQHLDPARRGAPTVFRVGEHPACDLWLPLEASAGLDRIDLVRYVRGRLEVVVLPGATAMHTGADGVESPLETLIAAGRAAPCDRVVGAHRVVLRPGERLIQDAAPLRFDVRVVPRPRLRLARRYDKTTPPFVAAAIALHALFLGLAWNAQADHPGLSVDVLNRDVRVAQMVTLVPVEIREDLQIAAETDRAKPEEEIEESMRDDDDEPRDVGDGRVGAKAAGDAGQAGDRNAPDVDRKLAVRGDPRQDLRLAKTMMLESVQETGALSALQALRNMPTSPFSPYTTANGPDPLDARGHLLGSDYGDALGNGGLALFGSGAGGGGTSIAGFGLNDVGTWGSSYTDRDWRAVGSPTDVRGRERSREQPALRAHQEEGPGIRFGESTVFGGLSKEAIRRVVQQHRGRIRHCYETALRNDGDVAGRVAVKFTITPAGSVQTAEPSVNTTGDEELARCVETVVRRMVFPAADGITACTYPFLLQMAGGASD